MTTRSPRRLLWLHQNFVSARQPGLSRAIYFLTALEHAGWHVDLITTRAGYLDDTTHADLSQTLVETEGRLTIHRLGLPKGLSTLEERGRAYRTFVRSAYRYARRLGPCDVVFASSPPLPQVLPALLLSVEKRAPLVLEVRDLWPHFLVEGGLLTSRTMITAMEWLEAWSLRYADHLVPNAPAFRTYLESMGVPTSRTTLVPTGGDPIYRHLDQTAGRDWRTQQGLGHSLLALFTGSLNENNGVDLIVAAAREAVTRCPQVVWLIAGDGRMRGVVSDAAGHLPNVRYLGLLPRDALSTIYAAADIALLPRAPWALQDTVIPGKLCDYFAAGLPVASVAQGQTRLMIETAGAGVTADTSSGGSLLGAVESLAALPAERRRALGRAGQDWILSHANAYRMGERLESVVARPWPHRSTWRGLARLCATASAACAMTLSGRARRAIASLHPNGTRDPIGDAFSAWLRESAPQEPVDYARPVAHILSDLRAGVATKSSLPEPGW